MEFNKLLEELRREWPVIKQAPLLFIFAVLLVIIGCWSLLQFLYKTNLDRKNDLIKTLKDQLENRPMQTVTSVPPANSGKPEFVLQLDGGNIFIPDQKPSLTGIVLDTIIINTGTPSIARDWQLSVVPPEGSPKTAQLTKIPKSLVARGQFNTMHINEAESLVESTLDRPLEANVPRSGKLLFYVSLPKHTVEHSVLELSVKDVKGNPFFVRKDIKEWMSR